MAMQSRGFRGEVFTLDDFQMQRSDWGALIGFIVVAGIAFWFGA
jgi:energy-coupling factor transporter transmembrane protein EcfT